jgi:hypothetical protein
MRSRSLIALAGALAAVVAISPLVATAAAKKATKPAAAGSLAGVCPATVVIQTDWFPEAEHGALYQIVGTDYKIDTKKKIVSGSLVDAKGAKTGVNVEVRTGGPAIGFSAPIAIMATDKSIHLGYMNTQEVDKVDKIPMVQVLAPLEKNPQMIMWDPATYPDVKTIDDLSKAGVTFNLFSKDTLLFFINDGRVKDSLADPSYDGSPARFIAEKGKIAQQGFASAEPYSYEFEFKEWGKKVAYQLLFDAGIQDYSQTLAVRKGDLATLRPCLKKLVPIIQQAQVDYIKSPDRANAMIVDAVAQYKDFWKYSNDIAKYSVDTQKKLGLVGNGPDKTLGNFDMARVQKYIDMMIKTGKFKALPAGFKAETLATNEFIDPKIGL